ncbi:MAG: hypothetical protein AAFV72_08550 [Cyanobacteria bacterium J06635_1]
MSPNSASEITYITATPSEAIDQLNQLICQKQALQKQSLQRNQAKTSFFSQATLQVRSVLGFFRVVWHVLFLEEDGIRQEINI